MIWNIQILKIEQLTYNKLDKYNENTVNMLKRIHGLHVPFLAKETN